MSGEKKVDYRVLARKSREKVEVPDLKYKYTKTKPSILMSRTWTEIRKLPKEFAGFLKEVDVILRDIIAFSIDELSKDMMKQQLFNIPDELKTQLLKEGEIDNKLAMLKEYAYDLPYFQNSIAAILNVEQFRQRMDYEMKTIERIGKERTWTRPFNRVDHDMNALASTLDLVMKKLGDLPYISSGNNEIMGRYWGEHFKRDQNPNVAAIQNSIALLGAIKENIANFVEDNYQQYKQNHR